MKTKYWGIIFFCLFSIQLKAMNVWRYNLINAGSKERALEIYNAYSALEKSLVWKDKIFQVNSMSIWSNEQLNLLQQLYVQIKPAIFNDSASFSQFHYFMESWKLNAKSKFSLSELRFILTTVHDYNPSFIPAAGDGTNYCVCSLNSDWCGGFIYEEKCVRLTCSEKTGCGTFWQYICNGMCQGAQPMTIDGFILY